MDKGKASGEISSTQPTPDVTTIQTWVASRIAAELGLKPEEIEYQVPFSEFGLDSRTAVSLVGDLERWLHAKLPPTLLWDHPTVEALAQYLADQGAKPVLDIPGEQGSGWPAQLEKPGPDVATDNLDFMELLAEGVHQPFTQRVKLYARRLAEYEAEGHSPRTLLRRMILSPVDREVLVLDPLTRTPKRMLMFGSNNYLGLANHPHVRERVERAFREFGTGLGGPPLLSGYTRLHHELEEWLAALKGSEDAMLFGTGYSANVGLVSTLLSGDVGIMLCDEGHHASFFDGLAMSRTRSLHLFRHNDTEHLEAMLERYSGSPKGDVFVAVEGVYSMEGDLAPLDVIVPLCKRYGAILLLDDAHSTGVMGARGHGTAEHFGVVGQVDITMGTSSKALAANGGFLAGPQPVMEYMRLFARSYMFSTSPPPTTVAGILGALEVIEQEPERIRRLHENVRYLVEGFTRLGLKAHSPSGIISLLTPPQMDIRRAAVHFHRAGLFINSVEFPAVPLHQQRFRISVMATHTREDLDQLLEVTQEVWQQYGEPSVYV